MGIVCVRVRQFDEEQSYAIGAARPPVGTDPDQLDAILQNLWDEWRQVRKEPESDSEFVDWLILEKGWGLVPEDIFSVMVES